MRYGDLLARVRRVKHHRVTHGNRALGEYTNVHPAPPGVHLLPHPGDLSIEESSRDVLAGRRERRDLRVHRSDPQSCTWPYLVPGETEDRHVLSQDPGSHRMPFGDQ